MNIKLRLLPLAAPLSSSFVRSHCRLLVLVPYMIPQWDFLFLLLFLLFLVEFSSALDELN